MSASDEFESLLDFWFGDLTDPHGFDETRSDLWFRSRGRFDRDIEDRFGAQLRQGMRGELDHWRGTMRGTLALVVLFDQFSRHVFRGTADAFAQDARALALTVCGIADGGDQELHPAERVFFYLPLEHAEDLERQRQSVAAYEMLMRSLPVQTQAKYQGFLDYALKHLRVIERFGRFPHRNRILNRESTEQELEFLAQPGSSF